MKTPDWYVLVLLALAAFRTWRLVAVDVITRPVRERIVGRSEREGFKSTRTYHAKTDEFVHCPWCLGFWILIGWFVVWWWAGNTVLPVAAVMAASSILGVFSKNLDP